MSYRFSIVATLFVAMFLALSVKAHAYVITILNYGKDPVTIINSSMILGEVERFGWVNARPNWVIELKGLRNISVPVVSDVLVIVGRPEKCSLIIFHVLSTIETELLFVCRTGVDVVLSINGFELRMNAPRGVSAKLVPGLVEFLKVVSANESVELYGPVTVSNYPAIISELPILEVPSPGKNIQAMYSELERLKKKIDELRNQLRMSQENCSTIVGFLQNRIKTLTAELNEARTVGPKAIMQTIAQILAPTIAATIIARAWIHRKRILRPPVQKEKQKRRFLPFKRSPSS